VLVNDGSTDNTETVCHGLTNNHGAVRLINSSRNYGKGHAVKVGMLAAKGTYALFTDADLAVPAHFIGPCLERLRNGVPIVIGSRHLPNSSFKVREGMVRCLLGEIFRRFTRRFLGLRVSDITCGFKGFSKNAAISIFTRSMIERWGYDAEIIFLAEKLGYPIKEIPVEWYHSFDSKVNVGTASVATAGEILRIYYAYLKNAYEL
jgi:glycosyltransferase involved in cell wall biosynthesis